MNENDIIPEAKIKTAVSECMRNPDLARYFNDAPPAAKAYIALQFYCTVYNAEVNDEQRELYLGEVLEDMVEGDVRYLLSHETDSEMRHRLNQLLAARVEETSPEDGVQPQASGLGKTERLPPVRETRRAPGAPILPQIHPETAPSYDVPCPLARDWDRGSMADLSDGEFWDFRRMVTPSVLKHLFKTLSVLLLVCWVMGIGISGYVILHAPSDGSMLAVLRAVFFILLETVVSGFVGWVLFLFIRLCVEKQLVAFTTLELLRQIRCRQ